MFITHSMACLLILERHQLRLLASEPLAVLRDQPAQHGGVGHVESSGYQGRGADPRGAARPGSGPQPESGLGAISPLRQRLRRT